MSTPLPALSLDLAELLRRAAREQDGFVARLERLVTLDSGSGQADGVRAAAAVVVPELLGLGMSVDSVEVTHPDGRPLGPVVVARRGGRLAHGARVLLVAHLDTVFPAGTAAERPFRIEAERALGPGVCDDKAGVSAAVSVLSMLTPEQPYAEIVLVLVPDEEIGSPGSQGLLADVARDMDVALCLESAREDGSIVSARKGAADLVFRVSGRAAHAGIEPERGVDAALAAAHLHVSLSDLARDRPGVSLNVGVVSAGTRPNVVADEAVLVADVRAHSPEAFDSVVSAARALAARPAVEGATVTVEVRDVTAPMERSAGTARLADAYTARAAELGLVVTDVATGGVADANLLAGLGMAVLDGLGPVGGNDHSPAEYLDLASVPSRLTLLAALIASEGARSST